MILCGWPQDSVLWLFAFHSFWHRPCRSPIKYSMRQTKAFLKSKTEHTLNALQVTSDISEGAVLISVNGRQEAYVENYRSLMDYTDQLVRIQAKHCRLVITGHRLQIDYYGEDEMKITGWIDGICYE